MRLPPPLPQLGAAWKRVGLTLTSALTFVAVLLTYLVGVGPTALTMRLVGKQALDRGPGAEASSWWTPRDRAPADQARAQRPF